MTKNILLAVILPALSLNVTAQQWPTARPEAKAGTRWWWLGSAVDKENLRWAMQEYANHGIGAVEITPLYGVQGNQANNIPYLSDLWMQMLREVQQNGRQMGIEVDMATGTGWPFGGPWVPLEESACKAMFTDTTFTGMQADGINLSVPRSEAPYCRLEKVMVYGNNHTTDVTKHVKNGILSWKAPKGTKDTDSWQVIALYIHYGVMKVKRAAPGGVGWVIDHFNPQAVGNYLKHIEAAFERTGTPYPHTFFNDSYEVAEATWTPMLFHEFARRRGYPLEHYLPQLLNQKDAPDKTCLQVISDYRETLSDLLLENFTQQWTAWAHSHGAITRNQAHGSPANLIDCYAAVDIPEIEGFGLSEFGIKGLRTDSGKTRKNDSDFSMLKYAPSAAHICGKPYTSSETFTWLTEHFRTSLSQLKPDIDLMFCAGVNHMFFHGTCYSPKNDPWPGWKFYASIDMSPTNSIWRDTPYFMQYVERCQSFLQWGQPDNDFLVYLPIHDMWQKQPQKLLMQFAIHQMAELAPEFIQSILDIDRSGFDCDYISDRLLLSTTCQNGMLQTAAGTRYKGLVIPACKQMPLNVKQYIEQLKAQGANIIYGTNSSDLVKAAKPEPMKQKFGLKAIRRKNPTGYHYFIANLTPNDVCHYASLAVEFKDALWFNPLTGERYAVNTDNHNRILLPFASGQSMILQTFDEPLGKEEIANLDINGLCHAAPAKRRIPLTGPWTLSFTEEAPKVGKIFTLRQVQTWETLDNDSAKVTMGTGIYTTHIKLKKKDLTNNWQLALGDVRESARVYINNVFIGCAWSVPYILNCKNALKAGDNEIRIEVTNLPANRIADYDRRGMKWRKMEEINIVDINYKHTTYADWEPMPSGLNSEVTLISY